ncbi:MAG TPA: DUF922 domain-containing protein [Bacteroidia bacterium]|jgi:hypothetical protein|nr:DUF922 domain-containing protein [Bacteroidia bacterium]
MKNRKFIFLFPFAVVFLLCSFALQTNSTKGLILWSADRPLTWKDFKVTQPASAAFSALTHWEILFTSSYDGDSLVTTTDCYFNPNESKVKKDSRTDTFLLGHEQFHFNIAELYTRKLRKAFSEAVVTKKDVNNKITKLYQQYVNDCTKEQDRYDNETNHSIKKPEQLKWQADIADQLKALDAYDGDVVKIYVK